MAWPLTHRAVQPMTYQMSGKHNKHLKLSQHIEPFFDQCSRMVGWLVVFYVPSTARSFRDNTPIYCP